MLIPQRPTTLTCTQRKYTHITEMRTTRDKADSGTGRWEHEGGDSILVSIIEIELRDGIVVTARRLPIIQRRRKRTKSSSRKIAPANEGDNSSTNCVALHESIRNTTGATRHQGCVVHESKLQMKNHKKKPRNKKQAKSKWPQSNKNTTSK